MELKLFFVLIMMEIFIFEKILGMHTTLDLFAKQSTGLSRFMAA